MSARKPHIIPELWPGSTIYILGGGPSLSKVDLSLIHSKRVIGVNQAFRLGNFVDILYFGDGHFYKDNLKDIRKFGGPIFTSFGSVPVEGWPKVLRVKRGKPLGIESERSTTISWNRSSGASAINIAFWLGAKRIVLIGFDMKTVGGKHHYHSLYKNHDKNHNPYHNHLECWPKIAEDAKALGIEIVNTTEGSSIKEIPYMPLGETL